MNLHFKCILLFLLILNACSKEEKISNKLSGGEILKRSIEIHDPNGNWENIKLALHIQEPRPRNPLRFSKIVLDNATGYFELIRNRDKHISKHVVDEQANAKVYLDDSEEIEDSLIKKYRLTSERNNGYKKFYKMMYGLPMSLKNEIEVNNLEKVEIVKYNNQECYKINLVLKEEMFSKNWQIYISKHSYKFKGMEIIFPEDKTKGERLYFEGEIDIEGINIPRIRHWHEYSNNEYSGSDVIVKKLEQ